MTTLAENSMKKPKTIDEYLAGIPLRQRQALDKLRKQIRLLAPDAEERISYGIPVFWQGRLLVGFGKSGNHCSFYTCSGRTIKALQNELKAFATVGKSTIRFQPDKPLSPALLRKLVQARLQENEQLKAKQR